MSAGRRQLQEAKNRLSEVVRRARDDGPRIISVRGRDAVVVLDADEYRRLRDQRESSMVAFFQDSPLAGVELDISRSKDTGRSLDL